MIQRKSLREKERTLAREARKRAGEKRERGRQKKTGKKKERGGGEMIWKEEMTMKGANDGGEVRMGQERERERESGLWSWMGKEKGETLVCSQLEKFKGKEESESTGPKGKKSERKCERPF